MLTRVMQLAMDFIFVFLPKLGTYILNLAIIFNFIKNEMNETINRRIEREINELKITLAWHGVGNFLFFF